MGTLLTFEAASGGEPYGVIVLRNGRATAYAGLAVLRDVFLGHAIMWLRERNPHPDQATRLYIIGGCDGLQTTTGHSAAA